MGLAHLSAPIKKTHIDMTEEKITYIKYCPNVFVAKCEAEHSKGDIIDVQTSRGNVHECKVHNFVGRTKDGCYAYSITRTDGTNRAAYYARKADQRREWADRQTAASNVYFDRSETATSDIVPGQPILVGHHSEKAHRAALARSWAAMGRAVEAQAKANNHLARADYYDRQAERITLDMPESLDYFTAELAKAKEYHEGVKSGKYPRGHAYTLTYAKKAVNELQKKVGIAEKLWGDR